MVCALSPSPALALFTNQTVLSSFQEPSLFFSLSRKTLSMDDFLKTIIQRQNPLFFLVPMKPQPQIPPFLSLVSC